MDKAIMHDLKPDRADLTPPLPAVLMAAPILFIVSVLATGGLSAWYTMEKKQAQQREAAARGRQAEFTASGKKLDEDTKEIEDQHTKAKDVQKWIASTHSLMDIVTNILTSVKAGSNLASLRLTRSTENSEHVDVRLLISSGGQQQKDDIVQSLMSAGYQTFKEDSASTDKTDPRGDVTYTATLVKSPDVTAEQP